VAENLCGKAFLASSIPAGQGPTTTTSTEGSHARVANRWSSWARSILELGVIFSALELAEACD
jgi:hypothetical protein